MITREMIDFIRSVSKNNTNKEIVILFNNCFNMNITYNYIKYQMKKYRIRNNNKIWTLEMMQYLDENAKGKGYQELTDILNNVFSLSLTKQQVKTKMNHEKIRTGKIPKNNQNTKHFPVGYEMKINGNTYVKLSDEKKKKGFMYNGIWKQKHRIVWEQEYGEIPKGHNVIFLDGNKNNFELNNLVLVTRTEQMQLNTNGLYFNNPELTKTSIEIARHKIAIYKKLRQVLGDDGCEKFRRERENEKRRIRNKAKKD